MGSGHLINSAFFLAAWWKWQFCPGCWLSKAVASKGNLGEVLQLSEWEVTEMDFSLLDSAPENKTAQR